MLAFDDLSSTNFYSAQQFRGSLFTAVAVFSSFRLNTKSCKFGNNTFHRFLWSAIILAATNPNETPAQSFQNCLSFHILPDFFFAAVPTFAITFDSHHLFTTQRDHIQTIRTDLPLLDKVIPTIRKVCSNCQFKRRFGMRFDFGMLNIQRMRVRGVVDQPLPHITRFQIICSIK